MTIQENLVDIEKIHEVRVLLAVESGSRAWGFGFGRKEICLEKYIV